MYRDSVEINYLVAWFIMLSKTKKKKFGKKIIERIKEKQKEWEWSLGLLFESNSSGPSKH